MILMPKVDFCGFKENFSSLNPALDEVVKTIERRAPELWKSIYTKIIQPPSGYKSWKQPAASIATSILQSRREKESAALSHNIKAAAVALKKNNFPVYYVGRELLRALLHTEPPKNTWDEIPLPFQGMTFMLPEGFLVEPVTGNPITFLSFSRIRIPNAPSVTYDNHEKDRMIIWYAAPNGIGFQSLVFPVTQTLKPSQEWVRDATKYYEGFINHEYYKTEKIAIPDEFLCFLTGLVANLILIKEARPELCSIPRDKTDAPVKVVKSNGNRFHNPIWLGEKYKTVESREGTQAGRYTELVWRSGHWRLQHHGPGGKQTKVIWIEAYVAHGDNLVREEVAV